MKNPLHANPEVAHFKMNLCLRWVSRHMQNHQRPWKGQMIMDRMT